jgi:outer membrane protein
MLKKPITKSIFAVTTLAMIFSLSMAQAQMYLSLDSARHYAIERNKNLINAGLAVDEANQRLRETIAQGLPQVNATVDYNNFFGSTATLGAMPGFEIEFNPTSNFTLTVGQMIFNGSYLVGIQTARLFREISEASLERTELEIKAQVSQAYYLVLMSLKSLDIVDANLENMREMLKSTRTMVETGIAGELDYDQLRVQSFMLENAVRAAERQVEMSYNMLRLQMGLDSGTAIALTDSLEDIVARSDFHGSLLSPFSLHDNIDFQLMELQISVAGKQVNLQRTGYLPTVMGFYNFTEKLLKPEFDITPNHVIGLNVSIPVFSSGIRKSRVSQARINLEITENRKELLEEQLMIQERQLRYNLNNALEQYESQSENVKIAQRVFENIRLRYQQGIVSSLDLTTANNNYLQAENSFISAMLRLLEAQVEMDKLLNAI